MRIALVSEHASPLSALGGEDAGGQNVHVAELARALGVHGHDVAVYTRRTDPDQPDTVELAPGARVRHVPAGPPTEISKDHLPDHMPAFGDWLSREWQRWTPDIVHAHYWMSATAALRGAAGTAIPTVVTFHALGSVKRRNQGALDTSPSEREETELAVARGADMIVATSTEERRELRTWGIPDTCVEVVPCGVDVARFRPEGEIADRPERPRVVSLGRLVPRKGVDTIVRALPAVPGAELVVAGGPAAEELDEDPEVTRLRGIAAAEGVADRVHFIGQVRRCDVPALLRSADVAVNVPWYEPFGMSTVEAMACGTPVIASNVGGHLDTMIEGVTGRLIPHSEPRALAFGLRTLVGDPVLRESYGIAAADRAAARYPWPLIARQTEARYDRALLRRRGATPGNTDDQSSTAAAGPAATRGGTL